MEIFILFWLAFSIGVGYLASQRGRSGVGWALLSLLTSPLLGLLFVLISKDLLVEAAVREREAMRHREQMAALTSATRQNAAPSTPSQLTGSPRGPLLVADELEKLGALKERGLLTAEEFAIQKSRLLFGDATQPTRSQTPKAGVRKAPQYQLTSTEDYRAALVALGCTVAVRRPGEWEVLQPSGVTVIARSPEELSAIYERL